MIRRTITAALISLFLPFAQTAAQETLPTSLTQELGAFQNTLGEWQKTLNSFDFDALSLDAHWLERLGMDRSSCLETMKTASVLTSQLVNEKQLILTRETLLWSTIGRIQDCLFKIHDFLNLADAETPPALKFNKLRPPNPSWPPLKWQGQISSMVSERRLLEGLEADIFRRTHEYDKQNGQPSKQGQISPQQQVTTPPPGQISGHVYRADTGEPLANAFVFVQFLGSGLKKLETSADGSYVDTGVVPGRYWVFAYRAGFVPQQYGGGTPTSQPIEVGPGQKLDAVDLRLVASPSITTMPDEGQDVASYTGPCRFCARFSPDGAFLALGTNYGTPPETKLWLYDMGAKRLIPVMLDHLQELSGPPRFGLDVRWADDDTLYIGKSDSTNKLRFLRLSGVKTAATKGNPQSFSAPQVSDVTADIASAFDRDAELHNERYIVGLQPFGHQSTRLTMRLDGTGAQIVADNVSNILFDKNRSLVFYQKFGTPYLTGTIVTFDLKTRQYRETVLPIRSMGLMDQMQYGAGSLVVYQVRGPCEPDDSFIQAEIEGAYRENRDLLLPRHLCFVKLP